jgi:uncharacterized protein YecT (DUF1311 family)
MARDRIEEIVARRSRSFRSNPVSRWEIEILARQWQDGTQDLGDASDFIPIRLVTMLEVFTRTWIATLVDAGEPYVERAGDLVGGSVKFDFGVVRALAGKQVSVGELVSHSVSINQLADLDNIFTALMGAKLFSAIENLVDRWSSEVDDVWDPIIPDIAEMRRNLASLFNTRHIVVHEMPLSAPYQAGDIGGYIAATLHFVHAVDQFLDSMLNGNFPLQQQPMNAEAWRRAEEKDAELSAWLEGQVALVSSPLFTKAQEIWTAFRAAQSEYVGGYDQEWPGTIAPLLQATEYSRLTETRLAELKSLVDNDDRK